MIDRQEYQDSARLRFEEDLMRAGFREEAGTWVGPIKHQSGPSAVIIELPDLFPFVPPRVKPEDQDWTAWSWHREIDGALCLVAQDDHDDLWWAEAAAFLGHVTRWFEQADAGWPDDRPDLDLERYFEPSADRRLVIYGDLEDFVGKFVRLVRRGEVVELVGTGTRPAKSKVSNGTRYGLVADLGVLTEPVTTWRSLAELLEQDAVRRVEASEIDTLLIRYERDGHPATVVLEVVNTKEGLKLRGLASAPDTTESRAARAGTSFETLQDKKVTVLGVGAVGSFVVDALARAGLGTFVLVDTDVVKPGNLVRHIADRRSIGLSKVAAVRDHLMSRHGLRPEAVVATRRSAMDADLLEALVDDSDLVIDTTADFSVTALLHQIAGSRGRHALSAYLQNDGRTLRVDVLPTIDGAEPLPPSTTESAAPTYYEAGCGSPVSPTPPQAVIEAAMVAARHAVGLLTGRHLSPAGEVRHLTTETL